MFDNKYLTSKLARNFLLKGELLQTNSLYYGKMEAIIFCYEYSKHINSPLYKEFADELILSVCEDDFNTDNISFAYGVSGIAWAILYLYSNNFISLKNNNEFLGGLDTLIMRWDPRRICDLSFHTGFEGILYYINTRLSHAAINKEKQPFDMMYINDIKVTLQKEQFQNKMIKQKDIFFKYSTQYNTIPEFNTGLTNIPFIKQLKALN